MARRLMLVGAVLALALVAGPAFAVDADTYHGTLTAAQHRCGDDPVGSADEVTGTWNLNVQASRITFNYRNPTTGTHVVWSNLGAWTQLDTAPYRYVNSYAGGFITFDATFSPADGTLTYVIGLPDCSYTGWDRLVVEGTADRGAARKVAGPSS